MKKTSRPVKITVKDGKVVRRSSDGKIAAGSAPLNPRGKKKGTLNRFTTLKQAFLEAFEDLGGTKGLTEWAKRDDDNLKVFYTLLARMLPREVTVAGADELQPGNLRGLKDEELDSILARHLVQINRCEQN